ncbi:hypothetical protein ILUMI_26727 [Ignelater luminosus]|uniref:DRBM domain-containing protein n=1 Tax=Ignelater luminosus TaxID=2038154 RepID=A0A8K0FX96_IGNLU|nr:hypothetical protein ILUMI_26727 [Ignelater luminosus]
MGETGEGTERRLKKNKPFWMRKEGVSGKINRKERLRRRNQRLRKILQPKNALMVLNELIGSAPYNMSENVDMYEGTLFKCTVLIDGVEHIGMGKSKPAAKTAAAEAALKHMVLSKLKNAQALDPSCIAPPANDNATPEGGEGEVKMEIDDDNLGGISWSHVACYALHKLLSSWDEGTNLAEKLIDESSTIATGQFEKIPINEKPNILLQLAQAAVGGAMTAPGIAKTFEKKPAKKLPETAATMNPIMLLNQMHPNAVYEEVAKSGNPPNVQFTIKCTIGGEVFFGTGSTKKGARKMSAFAACRKLLGIEYAPAFLEEHGFTEKAVIACTSGPAASAVAVA